MALDPNAAQHGNKSSSLEALGKYEEAIECYDKIIRAYSNDPAVHLTQGIRFMKIVQHDNAVRCFDAAIKLDPEDFPPPSF